MKIKTEQYIFKISSILTILFLFSCSKNRDEFNTLEKILRQDYYEQITKKAVLIVIPQTGCPGCIDRAIEFISTENEDNSNTFVILTNITDKKYFSLLIGPEIINRKNIFFDKDNEIGMASHITIYPEIFFIKNGKIKKYIEASPAKKKIWKKLSYER